MISPVNGSVASVAATEASPVTDPILCHCLRVRVSQVREAIEVNGCQTLKEVMNQTSAGTGCTACHRRILALLGQTPAPRHRFPVPCAISRCDCGQQRCVCRQVCSE